jgi:hypothetical protein
MAKGKKRVGVQKRQLTQRLDTRSAALQGNESWLDRMAEFGHAMHGAPKPQWMSERFLQKFRDSLVARNDEVEEILRKLEDKGTFQEMEAAGGVSLSGNARGYLARELWYAQNLPLDLTMVRRNRQKLAKKMEALAEEIEAELNPLDFVRGSPAVQLPLLLREFAQELDRPINVQTFFRFPGPQPSDLSRAQPHAEGRRGRRVREQDDHMIKRVAELYHLIGGRVAVGGGPFSKLLRVVWEAMPEGTRCASANTFVRRAKKLRLKLQELLKTLPRGWQQKALLTLPFDCPF